MTDKQINKAIANLLGITRKTGIPDFCGDLNAMHEAEMVLAYEQCAFFRTHLRERIEDHAASLFVWHATARQRAEAFVKTLGKWEEAE